MGNKAWQAALHRLVGFGKGRAYILMVCKLAAKCPLDDVWEGFLLQLIVGQAGLTALVGGKVALEGRPLPSKIALVLIRRMQSIPGKADRCQSSLLC